MQYQCSDGRFPPPRGVPQSRVKDPHPDDWTDGTGKVWHVIGGPGKTGILVRKGPDADAPILARRLAVDSLVEEVERHNDAMKYEMVDGLGPDIGWVDITMVGKPLLMPLYFDPEEGDVTFTDPWIV